MNFQILKLLLFLFFVNLINCYLNTNNVIFNATSIAIKVYKAINSSDGGKTIKILAKYKYEDRMVINEEYKRLYNTKIVSHFKGNLYNLVVKTLVTKIITLLADKIYNLLETNLNDDIFIIQIFILLKNDDLSLITFEYNKTYGQSLYEDLNKINNIELRTIFKSLISNEEISNSETNWWNEITDNLFDTTEGRIEFGNKLIRASPRDVANLADSIQNKYNQDLISFIKSKTDGKYQYLLINLVKFDNDTYNLLAEWTKNLMKILPNETKQIVLFFIILTKNDLQLINDKYKNMYGHSMAEDICKTWPIQFGQLFLIRLNLNSKKACKTKHF